MISAITLKPPDTKAGPTCRSVTLGKMYRGRMNMSPEADIYPEYDPNHPTEEQAFELWLDAVGRENVAKLQHEIEEHPWNINPQI
jgi:hypothetical protein